jgi:hypothetical protein
MQEERKKKKRNKGRRKKRPKKRKLMPLDFLCAGVPRLSQFHNTGGEEAAHDYMRLLVTYGNRWKTPGPRIIRAMAARHPIMAKVVPLLQNAKDAARFCPSWREVYRKHHPTYLIG